MTPLYCTIRQAIELTGTNKKRLNEWIKDGLPIYRPPSSCYDASFMTSMSSSSRISYRIVGWFEMSIHNL